MPLSAQNPQLSRHRCTLESWHRMIEAGVVGEDDRVELLHGEVMEMSPASDRHRFVAMLLSAAYSRLATANGPLLVEVAVSSRSTDLRNQGPALCRGRNSGGLGGRSHHAGGPCFSVANRWSLHPPHRTPRGAPVAPGVPGLQRGRGGVTRVTANGNLH